MYYYLKVGSDSTQRLRIYLAYAQRIHIGVISTTSEVLVVRAFLPPRNFSLPPPSYKPDFLGGKFEFDDGHVMTRGSVTQSLAKVTDLEDD